MSPEQIDLVDQGVAEVIQALGYCKVELFLANNPIPLTGDYERFDNATIILHNGRSGRWIINITDVAAIGVRT